jgi:hypothetical protein
MATLFRVITKIVSTLLLFLYSRLLKSFCSDCLDLGWLLYTFIYLDSLKKMVESFFYRKTDGNGKF